MHSDSRHLGRPETRLEVVLDGQPVFVPPRRRSLASIRSFLETLALEQQRVLCSFSVDGKAVGPVPHAAGPQHFARVEAKTMDLAHVPLQLVSTARQQIAKLRSRVASAVTIVLINESRLAREHWWNLARDLKQPLLTLSLMPPSACGSAAGGASLLQLRKWQLQQLAVIIKEVDESCWSADSAALSNALERRVLPWLDGLRATLDLWHETLSVWSTGSPDTGPASQPLSKPKAD